MNAETKQRPRVVCLACMRDVYVVWVDDYQVATRDWLARVRCHDEDTWIRIHPSERPLLLEDLGRIAFEQADLEAMERDACKTLERVAQIREWMLAAKSTTASAEPTLET